MADLFLALCAVIGGSLFIYAIMIAVQYSQEEHNRRALNRNSKSFCELYKETQGIRTSNRNKE